MPERVRAARARRFLALARAALDVGALVLALAWLASGILGPWSWPLPIALHAWSLAGPALLLGAGLALARRRAGPALLHLALLAAWTVGHAPRLLRSPGEPTAGSLTLVTLNACMGLAQPEDLARWAREQSADALFLQELGAAQAAALERRCADLYPYRELHGLGLHGVGVLSRWPLSRTRRIELPDGSLALLGELELRGRALSFAVLHLSGWVALLGPWGAADESLERVLAELGEAEPALVAGDFNATTESPLLDRLRRAGFAGAFDRAGSGVGLSFPVFLRYRGLPLPPLVRIDHVFLRGLEARAARCLPGAGSDHRALRVEAVLTGP